MMAEQTGNIESKNYAFDVPFAPFFRGSFNVKGAEDYDWGMKDRLSRIFNPKSGNTVMLAFDHGYMMGSTSGLERLDIAIPPLIPEVDVLMGTRGAIRTCIPPTCNKAIVLRCSAGSSVLDDDMSHENIAVDIEDAIRMNASCMAIQTFIGSAGQTSSIKNLCNTIDAGNRYGIPTLGVVAVGKQMERTTKFFLLATRMLAEVGAQFIKTYYCEDFEKIVAACPVPIVIAGGKKLPEKDALQMAYNAIERGAKGVDMGRNIFQSECPLAMARSISKIVHEGFDVETAYEFYLEVSSNYQSELDSIEPRR
jgi:putative autoinducer-2 (AI-2) aldolase